MEKLIEELNNHTENKYKFSLKSALLKKDADFCVLEIYYKDGIMLKSSELQELKCFILSIVPNKFKYEINFVKNFISEERIEGDFVFFMKSHFPSVYYNLCEVKREGMSFFITAQIDANSYAHAKEKNLSIEAQNYLKQLYEDFEFVCSVTCDDIYKENEEELKKQNYVEEEVDIFAHRKIEFTDEVPLVGEEIDEPASYIKDKTLAEPNIIVCGKIKSIKPVVIKKKSKGKEENPETENSEIQNKDAVGVSGETQNIEKPLNSENVGEEKNNEISKEQNAEQGTEEIKYERKLYKIVLQDFTGEMNCVFFSNKETQAKAEKLDTDSVIAVRGNLEEDKYSGGNVLSIKDISYCSLPENFEEYIEYRKEKPFYEFIKPEKVVSYVQNDLMNFNKTEDVPEYLKNKTYVCFDFETTGLHYDRGDKIIEIGAVKIVDGKITEKFMSYVDPERKIPAESSAISGIVDEDVKGAPKDYEALQDFYKFTRGAILTGYNIINFDMLFLLGQGKTCRWNFDNEVEDVYKLASKLVHGVKNYKLGTIAEHLGVVLDNAHRAVYDALATAEVFIKLAKDMKNDS